MCPPAHRFVTSLSVNKRSISQKYRYRLQNWRTYASTVKIPSRGRERRKKHRTTRKIWQASCAIFVAKPVLAAVFYATSACRLRGSGRSLDGSKNFQNCAREPYRCVSKTYVFFLLIDKFWLYNISVDRCRPELDVQLKCFHREDRRMENSWPQAQTTSQMSVQVQINGQLAPFRSPHRPLYVKALCAPGRNVLQITVNQCVCVRLCCLNHHV